MPLTEDQRVRTFQIRQKISFGGGLLTKSQIDGAVAAIRAGLPGPQGLRKKVENLLSAEVVAVTTPAQRMDLLTTILERNQGRRQIRED